MNHVTGASSAMSLVTARFISHPVRVHDEGGSRLPKTPSSARKVQLTKSGSNASVPGTLNRNSHRFSMGSAASAGYVCVLNDYYLIN